MIVHGLDLFLDLLIAAALGGAVGIQRQAAQKPAGFRTHLLVALASCAFAEVGRLSGDDRITANVLQGIGFLGAGAILRSGLTAHGLTTAASIWTVAAIGVAVGFGHPYSMAIGVSVTVITVIVLSISDRFFRLVFVHKASLSITCTGENLTRSIATVFAGHHVQYEPSGEFCVTNSSEGKILEMQFEVGLPKDVAVGEIVCEIAAIPGVRNVSSLAAGPPSM